MAKKGLGLGVSSKALEDDYKRIRELSKNFPAKGIWQPKYRP